MRLFSYIIQLAVLVWVVIWVADNPGFITINWLGLTITTHIGVALLLLALLLVIFYVVITQYQYLKAAPERIQIWRKNRQKQKAQNYLQEAIKYVALEQEKQASKYIMRAQKLYQTPLQDLVLAQLAEKNQNQTALKEYYTQITQHDYIASIGFLGLANIYYKDLLFDEALKMLEEIERLDGKTRPVIILRHQIYNAQKNWDQALHNMKNAPNNIIAKNTAQNYIADIYWARAEEYPYPDNKQDIEKTLHHNPAHIDAALTLAGEHMKQNNIKAVQKILGDAWQRTPHLRLAHLWEECGPKDNIMALYSHMMLLSDYNPNHQLSYYINCDIAVKAALWGQAEIFIQDYFALEAETRLYDKNFYDWDALLLADKENIPLKQDTI